MAEAASRAPETAGRVLLFAAGLAMICGLLVSASVALLADRQAIHREHDRRKNVLLAAGLAGDQEDIEPQDIDLRYDSRIREEGVTLGDGSAASLFIALGQAPAEGEADVVRALVVPVSGLGLWSTMYGYVAMDPDGQTIRGLTFHQHGETPGLGGEIEDARWRALWVGRRAFDEAGSPALRIVKGRAGPPDEAPHAVDSISGATITSRGVADLLNLWLGPEGFGPELGRRAAGLASPEAAP